MSRPSGAVWGRGVQTRAAGRPPPEYYWDGDHWSYTGGQHGDGREKSASEFARTTAAPNDPLAFLKAIDCFHSRGRDFELIHVGPKKGAWLDAATRARKPMTALEFGTQIGYSAIRIAHCLSPGSHLWTIEPNPENADLAEKNLKHVGLDKMVTVLRGKLEDVWQRVPCPVDLIFMDHSRAAYLRELKGLERWGYVAQGTVVITDNIGGQHGSHGHAKAEEYAAYVRGSHGYVSAFHWGDDDGIEVSEFIGLDASARPQVISEEWTNAGQPDQMSTHDHTKDAEDASQQCAAYDSSKSRTSTAGSRRWGPARAPPQLSLSDKLSPTLDECSMLPNLVVFDLDGVCWNPEMYQTRGGPPFRLLAGGNAAKNSAGEEIKLHSAVLRVWKLILDARAQKLNVHLAVASSSRPNKALPLLQTINIAPGTSMRDAVGDLLKMYYAKGKGKRPHLLELLEQTGVAPEKVLFLDDNEDNIKSVDGLGITAFLVRGGLTEVAWRKALEAYCRNSS
eukprot:TRINITY_DN16495_c0_g1_i1.p1 TRINITY_DN16495_c0_g1~~TRINITY_DN16495_c0_g1_i1.p1  ORF type:complete len:507 (+),score=74.91 TRINITY_DN16495_c0_g1_i1:215-1735(+)